MAISTVIRVVQLKRLRSNLSRVKRCQLMLILNFLFAKVYIYLYSVGVNDRISFENSKQQCNLMITGTDVHGIFVQIPPACETKLVSDLIKSKFSS